MRNKEALSEWERKVSSGMGLGYIPEKKSIKEQIKAQKEQKRQAFKAFISSKVKKKLNKIKIFTIH